MQRIRVRRRDEREILTRPLAAGRRQRISPGSALSSRLRPPAHSHPLSFLCLITNQDLITVWSGKDGPTLVSAAVYDAPTGRLVAAAADDGAGASSHCLLSWDAAAPEGSLPTIADMVTLPGRVVGLVSAGGPDAPTFVVFEDGRAVLAATAGTVVQAVVPASSRRTVLAAVGGGGAVAVITVAGTGSEALKVSLYGADGGALVQGAAVPGPPGSSSPTIAAAALCGGHNSAAHPLMLALAWADGVLSLAPLSASGGLGAPRFRRLHGFTSKPVAPAPAPAPAGRKRSNGDAPTPVTASDSLALVEDGAGGVLVAYPTRAGLAVLAVDGPLAAPRCAPAGVPAPPPPRSGAGGLHLTRLLTDDVGPNQCALLLSGPGGAVCTRLDTPPPGLASLIGSCPDDEGEGAEAAATAAATLAHPAWADVAAGGGDGNAATTTTTTTTAALATPLDVAALGGPTPGTATGPAAAARKAAAAAAQAVCELENALASRGSNASTATAPPGPAATAAADSFADAAGLTPLPADVLARGAAAAAGLGAWAAVKRALASQALPSLACAGGLIPAAAAAGEADLVALLLRIPDCPPEDAAALVEACLGGAWGGDGAAALPTAAAKRRAAALTSWRARLDKTAAGAVTDAEHAPAGPVRERAALRAAAAVAAVDGSFATAAGGSDAAYLLHGLVAGPRDEAALAASAGRLSPGAAPALACYLAAWARVLGGGGSGGGPAPAAAAPALGCPPPPPLIVPTISDVAAWASALVDAHLVALAGAARGGGPAAAAVRDLHALACVEAQDAAALAPLAGAAAHIAAAAPLPDMAVAAATVYSVELLDLGGAA